MHDELFKQFTESRKRGLEVFNSSPDMEYYIISKKYVYINPRWLEAWLENLSLGKEPPYVQINSDIIIPKVNSIFKYEPIQSHMWNRILLPNLIENVDYEIIDKDTWKIIERKYYTYQLRYQCLAIVRDCSIINDKKAVNVYPVALNMAAIFPSSINKFKGGKSGALIKGEQYVSRRFPLKDFIKLLEDTLPTVFHFVRKNCVRLYKAPIEMTMSDIESHISSEMKDLEYHQDPCFEMKEAEYLDPLKYNTIEDCEIAPDQVILADFKESQRNWCIKNPNFAMEAKCECCFNYRVLQFPCECKRVSYCSEECKKKDENYHLAKCEKSESDEETMNKLVRTETSRDGKVGLRNLGNTCFMNSGIQCLSNTIPLRDYLLSNAYKDDINQQNTLGTKGELCTKFANVTRKLWYDEKLNIPPFSLKRAIGKFQPQFQGFQQHDSQELITYLLDGLHEDLNRIKVKPYVERNDCNGRPDFEVAKESWDSFKLRNDSIIVDHMYGLYKSKLNCPKCDRVSITFDPYLMVSVSIPQNNKKKISIQFIDPKMLWDCVVIEHSYEKSQNLSLGDVLQQLTHKLDNTPIDQLVMLCSSAYQHDDTNEQEKLATLKKKLKYKKLYLRKALPIELAIPPTERITVLIHEAYKQYATYSWKRDLTPSLNFIFSRNSTNKDIHKLCYEIHIGILKSFDDLPAFEEPWEEYYNTHILDKVYSLEFKSNQNWQIDCAYCQSKQCNDCVLAYTDDVLDTYLQRDPKLEIEVFITWKRGLKTGQQPEELYNDWLKAQNKMQEEPVPDEIAAAQSDPVGPGTVIALGNMESTNDNQINTVAAVPDSAPLSLGECLKFSSQPEQLAEDNTWYCSKCQDHVQAFKLMEIYKVPNILIFHLKRFKNSNKFFKSKLDTVIDFPIQGLDMRQYTLNDHLPQQFSTENPNQPKSDEPLIYDLYAVANHFGGLGGGHYTAYAKNPLDGEWYNYDDSCVTQIRKEDVQSTLISSAAYVLFYQKRT